MNEIIKNDEMMCSDDFPESLRRFSENINKKNPGLHSENHNLYLLQTTDRDGNVTGEAYGMNLMTNWGFNIMYYTHTLNGYYTNFISGCCIFIGNGTDEPVLTNNALYSPIITTGSTNVSITRSFYPFTYNSNTDIATVRLKNYQGYFDYNLSGITEDKEITEIGYGKSTTQLFTHTRIYDSEGNPSSITKRINERLTITMYIACCCKMSVVEKAYDKQIYLFLNPVIFEPGTNQVYSTSGSSGYYCGGFGRDTHLVSNDSNAYADLIQADTSRHSLSLHLFRSGVRQQIDDNLIIGKAKINPERFFLESNNQYISNMIYSTTDLDQRYSVGSCRFYIIKPIQLSEPEELVSTDISTNSITSSLITDEFGLSSSSLPCTNFNITSLSMYNHLTKEWDIEESYLNDPNTDYNSTFYIAGSLRITFQDKSITAYVFTNIRTDLPITSFDNSNIVLYATDKYWDTSTWELISNLSSVDESLQCKRYYIITNENLVCLYPQRNMVYHKITTHKDSYTLPVPKHQIGDYDVKTLTNDKYGWIMSSKYLIYPNTDNGCVYYELTVGSNNAIPDYTWRWTTEEGDRLIFVYRQRDTTTKLYDMYIRIYDTTNPDSEPTYVDVKLDLPEQLNSYSMYCECTDSGMLVCKGGNNNKNHYMIIVDIYGIGEGPIQHRIDDVKIHWVLNRSDNVVYYKYDSINTYNIYDMRNQIITDSFTIPTEYTYSGICGWKDFIYVYVKDSSNTYTTFYYNIADRKLQQLMISRPELNNTTYVRSVDECMIVGISSPRWIWLFKASDPTNPTLLIDSSSYLSYYRMSLGSQLKYINDNKQLLFVNYEVRNGSSTKYCEISIFDIGYRLDTGNNRVLTRNSLITEYISSSSSTSYSKNGMTGFFNNGLIRMSYYGEIKWYPIENCVYHKIVGTTTTVQSYNNPKQLSELTFSLSVTNDMNRTSIDTPSSGT